MFYYAVEFMTVMTDMVYVSFINEPLHKKTNNLHMPKTKLQISRAVTARLISAFVFAP